MKMLLQANCQQLAIANLVLKILVEFCSEWRRILILSVRKVPLAFCHKEPIVFCLTILLQLNCTEQILTS